MRPSRWVLVGLYTLVVYFSVIQQPGQVTYDTRAELSQRPWGFLGEAFRLWHPESNLGEFQNQAYGYLFPQGLWFGLGDWVGIAPWVTQRLWTALVLVLAWEGTRRVALAMRFSPATAIIAGAAFALSPRLLTTAPVISAEALPGAVLPWVLLPIVLWLRGGLTARRAVLLSAAAVTFMGGVNAVEDAGSLLLVLVVVLWAARRRLLSARAAAAWVGLVSLASLWWVLPLALLARYSPPFYAYVESAADTTSKTGWSDSVRGDSHWVAYLITGDQSWWPAGHDLVANPLLTTLSAVIAAAGLVGLVRLGHPLRNPLVLAVLTGLLVLTAPHVSAVGGPFALQLRDLLDGPLQIFRNLHKIDPTLRLPLALGVGHLVGLGLDRLARSPRSSPGTLWLAWLGVVVTIAAMAAPYVVNHSRTPGWQEVSPAWTQARDYLRDHDDGTAVLVLPGTGFAQEQWGWTLDEPLTVLGGVRQVSRSQVPLTPGQSIRFLDELNRLASSGEATAHFPEQLARAGIGWVVVRRDLDRSLTGSPDPGGAAVSVANAGLTPEARFGLGIDSTADVEVFRVPTASERLRAVPVGSTLTVSGAPESILSLQDAGLVAEGRPTVLAGEPGWDGATDVVTDGDQRRERAFGAVEDAVSTLMGSDDPWRVRRPVHELPAVTGAPQVVAAYDGLRQLEASSSQAYADNFGPVEQQAGPYAAVDGDPATRWISSTATNPDQQWLRMDFDEPTPVHEVSVLPVVDDDQVIPIRTVDVSAGGQVHTLAMSPSGAPSTTTFDGSSVGSVEVRIRSAGTADQHARVGLREVRVAGVTPTRSFVVPGTMPAGGALAFHTDPEVRACTIRLNLPDCDVRRLRQGEEPSGMDRTFDTEQTKVHLAGEVVARSTAEADRLLEPLNSDQRVGASSVYGDDPRVSSRLAYDGQPTTVWESADEDPSPSLLFSWNDPRLITGIRLHAAASASPVGAVLRGGGGRLEAVDLVGSTVARLDRPLFTRSLRITFAKAPGMRHVVVPDLDLVGGFITRPLQADTVTGVGCGLGPVVVVDGRTVPTRVRGTYADILNGTPLRLEGCDPGGRGQQLPLSAGRHRLTVAPTREFRAVQLTGTSPGWAERAGEPVGREVDVRRWGASHREAVVGPGEASVLYLPENFNRGWTATVAGRTLRPLRVDGWQQAWLLPASAEAQRVRLDFGPQRTYVALLATGLGVSGLVLLAGAATAVVTVVTRRRPRAPLPVPVGSTPGRALPLGAALVLLAVFALLTGWPFSAGLVVGWLVTRSGERTGEQTPVRALLLVAPALIVAATALDAFLHASWLPVGADALTAAGVGLLTGLVGRSLRRPRGVVPT